MPRRLCCALSGARARLSRRAEALREGEGVLCFPRRAGALQRIQDTRRDSKDFFFFFASNNIYADTAGHAAKGTVIMTASKIAPQPPAKSEVRQPR